MAATALAAARIDPKVKARAVEVLNEYHLSESDLIRSVYEYVVRFDDVPEFVKTREYAIVPEAHPKDRFAATLDLIDSSPFSHESYAFLTDEEIEDTLANKGVGEILSDERNPKPSAEQEAPLRQSGLRSEDSSPVGQDQGGASS
jgi:antitoxin component of RelBE/YafQ-DinJ toxin-antitoxin module